MALLYARTLAGEEHTARDLAQEAFLLAWQSWSKFDITRDFASWLRGIIRNKWREHCRKHSLEPGKLKSGSLLRDFLLQGGEYREAKTGMPSLSDLIPTLSAIGWRVVPRATLAGVPVDLLLQNGGKYIAIDLIGTPGAEGGAIPLSKMLLLDRTDVTLVPLRLDEWLHRKNEVVEFLHRLLPASKKE